MGEAAASVVGAIAAWLVPAVVVFVVAAIALTVLIWALRRARVSPRARASADSARREAGSALVRLDDAVNELDLEVELSGALYGGDAPISLRRAKLTAQRVRDESFEEFRVLDTAAPVEIKAASARIQRRATDALAIVGSARTEHTAWMQGHVSAPAQIAAGRRRLAAVREGMGDPGALVGELTARYAPEETAQAEAAARAAIAHAEEAQRLLDAAAARAADPTQSALADVARAERELRQAELEARALEEAHRLVTQAAVALPDELEAARGALRQALTVREGLPADESERLGEQLRIFEAELQKTETDAARRPARTIEAIARLRDRLDLALGDARSAQQRLRGARTALPGTLAAARNAIAQAEASVAHARAGADARARLMSAQRELAVARQSSDPVDALDAARRAMRDAEDAKALADYDRLSRA